MLFEEIFRELNRRKIDYVVVGGVAVVMHGVVRLTADLDLMVHLDKKNLTKIVEVMNELGYKPKVPVKAETFIDPENRRIWIEEKNMKVFSFYHPKKGIMLIDIFVNEPVPYDKIRKNAVELKMGNLVIPTVSIEDLIKLKEISGRPQDIADLDALKRLGK
jgi:predicted nucleotidyltransferase